jgi:dihydroneopterin aldolase
MSEEWTDRILIRDLKLDMSIGIYQEERGKTQPVVVNIILDVTTNKGRTLNAIEEVVSYEHIVRKIKAISKSRHYELIERFAEDIASDCLNDSRIKRIEITAFKTTILPETSGVGICISRENKF